MIMLFTIICVVLAFSVLVEGLRKSDASPGRDLVSILLLSALLYLPMVDSIFFLMEGGSAHYLVLARSISSGHGLAEVFLPDPVAYTKTPFMMPLLLALADLILGYNILASKFIIYLFAILAGASIFFIFRPLDRRAALLIAALSLASPLCLELMRRVLTEIPYLGASFAALLLMNRAFEGRAVRRDWILLAVLIFFSYFLRSAGISLIAAFAVTLLIYYLEDRGRKEVAVKGLFALLPTVIGALLWSARGIYWRRAAGLDYLSEFLIKVPPYSVQMGAQDLQAPMRQQFEPASIADLAGRAWEQCGFYVEVLSNSLLPYISVSKTLTMIAALLLIGLAVAGLGYSLYKRQWLIPIYGLAFFTMTILWPYRDPRFIVPFLPIFIFGIWQGLAFTLRPALKQKYASTTASAIVGLLLILVMLLSSLPVMLDTRGGKRVGRDWRKSTGFTVRAETEKRAELLTLLEWVELSTPEDSLILFHSPRVVYLVTGRKCLTTPITKDPALFWEYVEDKGVDYIIVDELYREIGGGINMFTPEYVIPALNAGRGKFEEAFSVEGTQSVVLSVK